MRYLLILLFLNCLQQFFSQNNIVPNWSFEDFKFCPKDYIVSVENFPLKCWTIPTKGTSDYYNSSCDEKVSTPNNVQGNQLPRTGKGYAGFVSGLKNYSEYLQVMLETCLEKDSSYYVEFYVSLSEKSNYSSKMIGAYFSENEIKVNNSKRLKFTPQIKNESFVVDTLNWVKISGVYKAKGDEQFLIIGNFGKNKTKFDKEQLFAYYYLDDVCVRKIVEK